MKTPGSQANPETNAALQQDNLKVGEIELQKPASESNIEPLNSQVGVKAASSEQIKAPAAGSQNPEDPLQANNSKGSTTNQSMSIDVTKDLSQRIPNTLDETTLSKNQILPMTNKNKETAPGLNDSQESSKDDSLPSSNESQEVDEKFDDDGNPNPIGVNIQQIQPLNGGNANSSDPAIQADVPEHKQSPKQTPETPNRKMNLKSKKSFQNNSRNPKIETYLKSFLHEAQIIGVSVAYFVLLCVLIIIEDKLTDAKKINVQGLDILQVAIMIFYFLDLVLNIMSKGLKDYMFHCVRFLEFVLITACLALAVVELVQDINGIENIRYKEFFVRLAKFYLIARKISAAWMRLEQIFIIKSFEKESVSLDDMLLSQEGLINLMGFLQRNFVPQQDSKLYSDMFVSCKIINKQFGVNEHDHDEITRLKFHDQVAKSPYKKVGSTSEGYLWYDVYTGYQKLQTRTIPDTMSEQKKTVAVKNNKRRGSLISKEDMARMKMQSFASINEQAVAAILGLNDAVKLELTKIDQYNYNIFEVRDKTNGNELTTTIAQILAREKIFDNISVVNEKFVSFLVKIQSSYNNITYHNKSHGADLAQTFYYVCTTGGLKEKLDLDPWEMMSYTIAGACHDIGHPGFSNVYLIEKKDDISIRYNDISVLENFHVATAFDILKIDKYNVFSALTKDQYKRVRKIMIGAILATDMALHFAKIGVLKSKLASCTDDTFNEEDRKFICDQFFHLCDISNATRNFDICEKWTNLLFEEFFHQGDQEKIMGVQVSQFMDRCTTNVAKSQIGFINFIIKPSFGIMHQFLPNIHRMIQGIELNEAAWKSRVDQYQEIMEIDAKEYEAKKTNTKADQSNDLVKEAS